MPHSSSPVVPAPPLSDARHTPPSPTAAAAMTPPPAALAPGTPAAAPHSAHALSPVERRLRIVNLAAVTLPIAALVLAILLTWGAAFDWVQFGIFIVMTYATAIGITVGYHRLFTHLSFSAGPVVRYTLAALGSMAVQGAVIEWAGTHRCHHSHSDEERDPHSPHVRTGGGSWGRGIVATLRGLFHSHVGWLLGQRRKGMGRYTKDLRADRVVCAVNRQFYWWALAGLLIPAAAGGLLTLSLKGALLGLLWGGLVRILFVHHITWSVNSVCHLWGTRPFRSGDHSRNNAVVGILALGEGWHNNHHAFPASARHGLRWWEFDLSYLFIRTLAAARLARNIKTPPRERVEGKRRE